MDGDILQGNYNSVQMVNLYPRESIDGDSLDFVPAGNAGGAEIPGVVLFHSSRQQDENIANMGQVKLRPIRKAVTSCCYWFRFIRN